jgi:phage terminase large subunit-like protein
MTVAIYGPARARPRPQTPPAQVTSAPAIADRATAYARAVVAGEVVTGRPVRLACERHLRDLEHGHERGLRWNAAKSEMALHFFDWLHHFEGPTAGEVIVLQPWQCFDIGAVFGWERWHPEANRWVRRFTKAFTEVAKKNGKSLMAGGIGLLCAFFLDEPGAQVYAAATKRAQAKLVWGAAKVMVEHSPALRARIRVRVGSLFDPRTNSTFQPLGREMKTEDGINPSAVIIDEEHRHEDRSLINLLSQSFGARLDPLMWIITTAGTTGESVWNDDHDYAVKVLDGIIVDDSLFAYIANLDPGDDPFDEAVWIKANPNLGVIVSMLDDIRKLAQVAQEMPGALNDFLRLRLNVKTQSVTRWMTPQAWATTKEQPDPLSTDRAAYGGLDLGSRDDLAAFLLLLPAAGVDDAGQPVGGFVDVFARFWCPQESISERSRRDRVPYDVWAAQGWIKPTPGNVTDYDVIRADINALAGQCYLPEIGYDPYDATQIGSQLTSDGFAMVRIMQSTTEFSEPVKELEKLVAEGRLCVGENPVLAWMVDNTVMVQDAAGRRKPDKAKAREKIDGVAALLMALKRLMAHAADTEMRYG